MAMMLLNKNATVTICHSRTRDLKEHIKNADIVVGAVGIPRFIEGDWIKDGAIIIDAGYHPEQCGDIDLDGCANRSLAYTPVPGGVGPMTINTLILQTIEACETQVVKMSTFEVVIVGSGFSGLTSAHFLKNEGIENVCILEKNSSLGCLLYTSPSPRDAHESRMPSSA